MRYKSVPLAKVLVNVVGIQRAKLVSLHGNKPIKGKQTWTEANEEALYQTIIANMDSEVIEAEFDTEQLAATIGLRIEAKSKGRVGAGIQGKMVHFWERQV